jgi:transposase
VMPKSGDRVVIAIDPHRASWTAVAVDASLQAIGHDSSACHPRWLTGRCAGFARRWPHAQSAVEGASRLGAPLTAGLRGDGIQVLDVPAKLAARVRLLSTGYRPVDEGAGSVAQAGCAARPGWRRRCGR